MRYLRTVIDDRIKSLDETRKKVRADYRDLLKTCQERRKEALRIDALIGELRAELRRIDAEETPT